MKRKKISHPDSASLRRAAISEQAFQQFRRQIAALITKRREASGLSRVELAWRAGISVQALVLLETQERQPRTWTLLCLERALCLQPGDLLIETARRLRR
jgi:ribosome-binding protein aMBF1 (putative translation factor)